MFHTLPVEIIRTVLEEHVSPWQVLYCLSRLDVAFCNHQHRNYVMFALAQVEIIEDEPDEQYYNNRQIGRDLANHLDWIASRNMRRTKLHLHPGVLYNEFAEGVTFPVLIGVKEIYIRFAIQSDFNDYDCEHVRMGQLIDFMGHFPSLRVIDCDQCVAGEEDDLEDVRIDCPLLEVFKIRSSYTVPVEWMTNWICGMGQTLKVLSCTTLDDVAVTRIAECCQHLECVSIACNRIFEPFSIGRLCARNGKQLESLTLYHTKRANHQFVMTAVMIQLIARTCSKLKHADFEDVFHEVTSDLVLFVVNQCPQLEFLQLDQVQFEFKVGSGVRTMAITDFYCKPWDNREPPTFAKELYDICKLSTVPVCETSCHVAGEDHCVLPVLVRRFASHLEVVRIYLPHTVHDDQMILLFMHSPSLSILSIDGGNGLINDVLMGFPKRCPKMKEFQLSNNHTITDNGLLQMIMVAHENGRELSDLSIHNCSLVIISTQTLEAMCHFKWEVLGMTEVVVDIAILSTLIRTNKLRTSRVHLSNIHNEHVWACRECRHINILFEDGPSAWQAYEPLEVVENMGEEDSEEDV